MNSAASLPAGVWLPEGALPVPPAQRLHSIKQWSDFGVFGLSFYDDQSPWFTLIEVLQISLYQSRAGKEIFPGIQPDASGAAAHETLAYDVPLNTNLRHLLFRDKEVARLASQTVANPTMLWSKWLAHVQQSFPTLAFGYLREAFKGDFIEFAEAVDLLRSAEVEQFGARRWTSRHLLPLGPAMMFPDVKPVGTEFALDRRFFQRTGELLWLMLNRSSKRAQVGRLVGERLLHEGSTWNRLARRIQGPDGDASAHKVSSPNIGYLPLASHPVYDRLGQDWASVLSLTSVPVEDCLECLMRLSALHEIVYIVERACAEVARTSVPPFIMDLAGTARGNPVYVAASESYKMHRSLPMRAVEAFIMRYAATREWSDLTGGVADRGEAARLLKSRFLWEPATTSNFGALNTPGQQIQALIAATQKRSHDVGSALSAHARKAGLLVARRSSGTWYSPSDGMLEALVLANVRGPTELSIFLERLRDRYRIVIGPEEARSRGGDLPAPLAALKRNEQRLEERLRILGFIDRKSDDCAFVVNPFFKGEQLDAAA